MLSDFDQCISTEPESSTHEPLSAGPAGQVDQQTAPHCSYGLRNRAVPTCTESERNLSDQASAAEPLLVPEERVTSTSERSAIDGGGLAFGSFVSSGMEGEAGHRVASAGVIAEGIEDILEDQRQCRICFEYGESHSTGVLLRPCLCRGTMAWVHMQCLETWRHTSTNRKSFYHCDQCKYEYKFKIVQSVDRLSIARLLAHPLAVPGMTGLTLVLLVFANGFIYKFAMNDFTWYEILDCFNLMHFTGGAVFTGILSMAGWIFSVTPYIPRISLGWLPSHRNLKGDKAQAILLAIAVAIGLALAVRWIYQWLEGVIGRRVKHVTKVILDVQA